MANTFNLGNKKWAVNEGKVLAYNSENNNFKPLPFDFTRASSATVVNKEGLIEVVSNNEPRIDFLNDSKGALLLEPSRSNVLPYSSDFSQWSTASGASVVGNKLGVGGSNDAFEFFSDGTSSTRLFYTVSITGESSYSLFAKKNTLDYISLYANDDNNARVWFNLDNGTLGNQEGGGTGVIEDYGNGWYRCTLKWTPSNLVNVRIYNSNENDVFGGTAGSVYIQYAQLEAGSYATSYIPTSGSSVTRVADACIDAGNEQVINSTEGTIYGEQKSLETNFTYNYFVSVSDGTQNNRLEIRQSATGFQFLWRVGGTYQNQIIKANAPFTSVIKFALRYSSTDIKFYVNGSLVGTLNSPTLYATETLNNIEFADGSGGYNFRGIVKDLRLYNTALTDAELIALTS